MYRLADHNDKTIQRIVSNEMARGMLRCLGIEKATMKISIGKCETDRLLEVFEFHEDNTGCSIDLPQDVIKTVIARKLERMYEELLDTENEYTFDELGEYLIAIFIEFEEGHTNRPGSSASVWDEIYVRQYFEKELEDDEGYLELTKSERESLEEAYCNCVLYFACMGIDDEDTSLIFMDTDYKFLDVPGGGSFLLDETLGFVSAEDEREPVSGSIKNKL